MTQRTDPTGPALRRNRSRRLSAEALESRARDSDIPVRVIGRTGGDALCLPGAEPVPLERLNEAHEGWLPRYMRAM